jgi:hypothetical protein
MCVGLGWHAALHWSSITNAPEVDLAACAFQPRARGYFFAALRAAQKFREVRKCHVPSAQVRQRMRMCATLMSASSAFDDQQELSKLIGQTQHPELYHPSAILRAEGDRAVELRAMLIADLTRASELAGDATR